MADKTVHLSSGLTAVFVSSATQYDIAVIKRQPVCQCALVWCEIFRPCRTVFDETRIWWTGVYLAPSDMRRPERLFTGYFPQLPFDTEGPFKNLRSSLHDAAHEVLHARFRELPVKPRRY